MYTQNSHYRVTRVDVATELGALRQAWSALVADIPRPPVFLTWEWISTWCRHMEPDWQPWLLAVRDGTGRLAGLAPWMLTHHRYGPLRVDRLAFMGSNYAYRTHQDILARSAEKEAVFAALLEYLRTQRNAWDVLDLEALGEGSPIGAQLGNARGIVRQKEPVACPYTALPGTWENYELQKLSANRRQQLRARRRKLERDFPGQVSFERVRTPEELGSAMDGLIDLHRKRWHGRGQASSFDIPSFAAFHRELAALALECDWLRLYLLKVGGQPIAAEYCFLYEGVLFDYQKGFDPAEAWEHYSPGQLVLAYGIQDAIAEGATELDMARGNYEYKVSWTDRERIDTHVVWSTSLAGHAWVLGSLFANKAMTQVRQVLPDDLRQRINRRLAPAKPAKAMPAADDGISPAS